jgi:hypothetical protein
VAVESCSQHHRYLQSLLLLLLHATQSVSSTLVHGALTAACYEEAEHSMLSYAMHRSGTAQEDSRYPQNLSPAKPAELADAKEFPMQSKLRQVQRV